MSTLISLSAGLMAILVDILVPKINFNWRRTWLAHFHLFPDSDVTWQPKKNTFHSDMVENIIRQDKSTKLMPIDILEMFDRMERIQNQIEKNAGIISH